MITIDLLKGDGLPVKSRPLITLLATLLALMPLLVAGAVVCDYMRDGVILKNDQAALAKYDDKLQSLRQTSEFLNDLEVQHEVIDGSLNEVAKCITVHSEWSPILMTIAESVPESLALTRLALSRRRIMANVPSPDNPDSTVLLPGYRFVLQISTDACPDNIETIKQFIQRLRESETLAPRLEDCYMESKIAKSDLVSYDIHCVFKTRIVGV